MTAGTAVALHASPCRLRHSVALCEVVFDTAYSWQKVVLTTHNIGVVLCWALHPLATRARVNRTAGFLARLQLLGPS